MVDAADTDPDFEALLEYLLRVRGFDFTGYKRASLHRRIDRRIAALHLGDYAAYQDFLEVHPDEFAELFDTVLINVTGFFRDAPIWDYIAGTVLPELVAGKSPDAPIRVWSAGCASGEEPYTLAMVLARAIGAKSFRERVKIYATDVDEHALAAARTAMYSDRAVRGVPAECLDRYFARTDDRYVFSKELRQSVIFGRHDLIQDAPISRIDLLVCRNTLIYLNGDTQGSILKRLNFALNDDGYLFLGKAEMLLSHSNLFVPVDVRRRIFRKSEATLTRAGPHRGPARSRPADDIVAAADRLRQLAVDSSPVAQLAIDADGRLAFFNERCAALFDLTQIDVGRPFSELEPSYRPVELRRHLAQVEAEGRPIRLRDIEWPRTLGERLSVDVQLVPLLDPAAELLGIAISFVDVTRYHQLQTDLEHANLELETAYEELQSTNEELETTNEELQSSVEELETTNEELQSTNEELETMNEELHSTNEELHSINEQLRGRTSDLNEVNLYLQSILGSMDSGVAVVDRELRVRMWNRHAEDLWGLRANEVAGEPLLLLDIGLPVDQLGQPLKTAITEGKTAEVRLPSVNRRGRKIDCHIRVMPLSNCPGAEPHGAIVLMAED